MKKIIVAILLLAALGTGTYFVRQTADRSTPPSATNQVKAQFGPAHPLQLHHQTNGGSLDTNTQQMTADSQTGTQNEKAAAAGKSSPLNSPKPISQGDSSMGAGSVRTSPTKYQGMPMGSKITIEGDSTTHKWTMIGTMIGGTIELDPGVTLENSQATLPVKDGVLTAKAQASIPVRSLHSTASTKPDIMDGLYQEALKEPQFPKIVFTLKELKLKDGHAAGKPFEFDGTGELSIAGVTNKITIPVKIDTDATDKRKIRVTGNAPLKMTAFGIKPPAPNIGLGLMKCADDVNIVFNWLLIIRPPQSNASAPPGTNQ